MDFLTNENFTIGIISGITASCIIALLVVVRGLLSEKISIYIDLRWGVKNCYTLNMVNTSKFTIRTTKFYILTDCRCYEHILSNSPIFINKKLGPGQMIKYNFVSGELSDKDEIIFCLYYETLLSKIGSKIGITDDLFDLKKEVENFHFYEQKTESAFCLKEYGRKFTTGEMWTNRIAGTTRRAVS